MIKVNEKFKQTITANHAKLLRKEKENQYQARHAI